MLKRSLIGAAMLIGLVLTPVRVSALDMGLTPSHVFSIWVNVNSALLAIAQARPDDAAWSDRISSVPIGQFEGKRPSDVLALVGAFRNRLDALFGNSGLPKLNAYYPGSHTTTPSDVFINSGFILDGLVLYIIRTTEPGYRVTPFFDLNYSVGKTPSDVYGLVHLANRRLDLILERAGN